MTNADSTSTNNKRVPRNLATQPKRNHPRAAYRPSLYNASEFERVPLTQPNLGDTLVFIMSIAVAVWLVFQLVSQYLPSITGV
jgi:hypothetical protein